MRSPAVRPTTSRSFEIARGARRRVPVVALHCAVAGVADHRAVDVMARAAIAAAEAIRVCVDELRFVAGDGRAFAVHEPPVDRERGPFRGTAHRDRVVDGEVPWVIEVEVRNRAREAFGVGEPGGRILCGVPCDRERLGDARLQRFRREIGGAGVPASLSDEDGDADPLVPIVGNGLDLAVPHGDALADRLRDLGLHGGCAPGTRRRRAPTRQAARARASAAGSARAKRRTLARAGPASAAIRRSEAWRSWGAEGCRNRVTAPSDGSHSRARPPAARRRLS